MAFMISRETENVKSSEEIESAFRALSSEGKPYVTKEELYQVGPWEGPELLGTSHSQEACVCWPIRPGPTTPYLWALVMAELTAHLPSRT